MSDPGNELMKTLASRKVRSWRCAISLRIIFPVYSSRPDKSVRCRCMSAMREIQSSDKVGIALRNGKGSCVVFVRSMLLFPLDWEPFDASISRLLSILLLSASRRGSRRAAELDPFDGVGSGDRSSTSLVFNFSKAFEHLLLSRPRRIRSLDADDAFVICSRFERLLMLLYKGKSRVPSYFCRNRFKSSS